VGSTIDGNTCPEDGGGLRSRRSVAAIHQSTLSGNSTADDGGAIRSEGGFLFVSESTIRDNVASDLGGPITNFGGGIFNDDGSVAQIVDSTMSGNRADDDGGALRNQSGSMEILRSTISDNSAGDDAGGLDNEDQMVVTNSTISGNKSADGAGMFNRGTAELSNVTVAGNTASNFGGGLLNGDTLTYRNTIVAGNQASFEPDCRNTNTLVSEGHNLVGIATGCPLVGSDIAVDPATVFPQVLGPLQNNAGPTHTHALPVGSSALNAGNAAGCLDALGGLLAQDQRDLPRPQAVCDIGAFERQPTDAIRALVLLLEAADLKRSNLGLRDAMLSNLATADKLLAKGKKRNARKKLVALKRRVDGCGRRPDRNDWVVNCPKQKEIRGAINDLL